jgi:hypothetical protein
VSDIDTVVVDSLKVLDPKRPIREADIGGVLGRNCLSANDPQTTFATLNGSVINAAGRPYAAQVLRVLQNYRCASPS